MWGYPRSATPPEQPQHVWPGRLPTDLELRQTGQTQRWFGAGPRRVAVTRQSRRKAAWKETVRPAGCLLSMDAHHNMKKSMPLATERPGNHRGQRQLWRSTAASLSVHCHAVRRDVKRSIRNTLLPVLVPCNKKETDLVPWPSLLREAHLSTRVAAQVAQWNTKRATRGLRNCYWGDTQIP